MKKVLAILSRVVLCLLSNNASNISPIKREKIFWCPCCCCYIFLRSCTFRISSTMLGSTRSKFLRMILQFLWVLPQIHFTLHCTKHMQCEEERKFSVLKVVERISIYFAIFPCWTEMCSKHWRIQSYFVALWHGIARFFVITPSTMKFFWLRLITLGFDEGFLQDDQGWQKEVLTRWQVL